LLRSYGNHIIEPAEGELASHLIGKGRMEEPEKIVAILDEFFSKSQDLVGKEILITAGPTYERIDPVRFIGNFSSGKMGYAIAEEAASRGAHVTLVSGPVSIKAKHPNISVINVESAREMFDACLKNFDSADFAIMSAAVADYRPTNQLDKKIKREKAEFETLELTMNPDIAANLGIRKKPNQRLIGFALETDNAKANGQHKLQSKNLDMIVINSLADAGAGFQTDTNKISIQFADGRAEASYELKPKTEVAKDIINNILSL
jgi:phosphopantothenoylcysteine decarboxylase/phosphopantothenate--cysteine ligase